MRFTNIYTKNNTFNLYNDDIYWKKYLEQSNDTYKLDFFYDIFN